MNFYQITWRHIPEDCIVKYVVAFVSAQKPNEGRMACVNTPDFNSGGTELLVTETPPVQM
jgi:hypothetical protein